MPLLHIKTASILLFLQAIYIKFQLKSDKMTPKKSQFQVITILSDARKTAPEI